MIKTTTRALVLGAIPFLSISAPAHAQVSTAAITAACETQSADCQLLVQQAIAELQASELSDAEYGAELARLSASVVQSARNSPAAASVAAAALRDVAAAARDEDQGRAVLQVADVVEAGGAGDVDTVPLPPASPA